MTVTLTTGQVLRLLNEDGSYNRQGIMLLANANWAFRSAKGWNLKADRTLAFVDAWHRAKALRTRFAITTGA